MSGSRWISVGAMCQVWRPATAQVRAQNWKGKCAGLEVWQPRHLTDVEGELTRLKRMYADLAFEGHAQGRAVAIRLSQAQRLDMGLAMQEDNGLNAR